MDSYFDIDRHQMPVHKVKPNEIEKFRYFREFLKRSERYKKLCDLVNETKRTAPFENELIRSWCCCGKVPEEPHIDLAKPYRDWVWENIPKEIREQPYNGEMSIGEALEVVYGLFQDVFNDPFEDVIHRVKLFYEFYEERGLLSVYGSVHDLVIRSHNHHCEAREVVDLLEICNNINRYLDASREGDNFCYNPLETAFIINPHSPREVIKEDFKYILERIYKGPRGRSYGPMKPFFTTGNLQLDFYPQCLDAFDAFCLDGKNKEVIERIMRTDERTDEQYDSHVKTFSNRVKSAIRFIKQAEKGVFPQATKDPKVKEVKGKIKKIRPEYSKIEHIAKRQQAEKMLRRIGPPKDIRDFFKSEN